MTNTTLFLLLGIASLVAIIILGFIIKKPGRKRDSTQEYTTALNYLIVGDQIKALQKLREAVRKDTSNIDAYLKIGDILRELGVTERAIKVHRDLTVRSNLTPTQRLEILKCLVEDYRAAGKYDRAIAVTQKILELNKNDLWAQETQLKLYEEKEDWEMAFAVLKKLLKSKGERRDSVLALYKVQEGLKLIEEGKEKEGRIKFREAMKLDSGCPPAYLYLGDSYIREKRQEDALNVLKRFVENVPQFAYLAFERMKAILFEIGNFGEIENIYNSLIENNPDLNSVRFALAEIYDKKGEINKAVELCYQVLEKDPESRTAKQYLVKFYHKAEQKDKAMEYALKLVEESLAEGKMFRCQVCRFESKKPFWRCPRCKEWNSLLDN